MYTSPSKLISTRLAQSSMLIPCLRENMMHGLKSRVSQEKKGEFPTLLRNNEGHSSESVRFRNNKKFIIDTNISVGAYHVNKM